MRNVGKEINEAFDKEDWKVARQRILAALKKEPDSHWLLSKLSAAYYEEREYDKALEFARKAEEVAPECPLVMWDLAGALLATGDVNKALALYLKIIAGGVKKASSCPHGEGEGRSWAVLLLLDSIFMAGVCHQRAGENDRALWCFAKFLELSQGLEGSVNSREDAIERISTITGQNGLVPASTARQIKHEAKELLPA